MSDAYNGYFAPGTKWVKGPGSLAGGQGAGSPLPGEGRPPSSPNGPSATALRNATLEMPVVDTEADSDEQVTTWKARGRWTPTRIAVLGVVVAYLGLILGAPMAAMLARVIDAGQPPVLTAIRDPQAMRGLMLTGILTLIAVIVNAVVGVGGAMVLVRHRFPGRRILDALIDMPLAVSPVMIGLAFLLVFGRTGYLAPILQHWNIAIAFAFPGMVIATLFVTLPFTLREVAYVLEELGTQEEEAAATMGASSWQTFWHVTLPNIRYGLGYGILLTLARSLGEFGAVLVLGGAISGRTQTATTFIFAALDERQEAAAYGMAMILALISVVLLMALERLKPQHHRS